MDDLLQEFEKLLDAYHRLIEASNQDRGAYAIMRSHHAINEAARDVVEFLVDYNATVTFPAPSAPDFEPEPWQVRYRPDLTGRTWEVFKSDERYTVDMLSNNPNAKRYVEPIYHCGCGRYICQHVDAVKAFRASKDGGNG